MELLGNAILLKSAAEVKGALGRWGGNLRRGDVSTGSDNDDFNKLRHI